MVPAALIAARGISAGALARQAGCTASHLSHILPPPRPALPALAARLDTVLAGGGQAGAALGRTPAARLRRPGPRLSRRCD